MSGFSTTSLQIYQAPASGSETLRTAELGREEMSDREHAEWLACRETWRPFPPRRPTTNHTPYTLDWFKEIEQRRYARHGRWIPQLFEFNRHQGDQVLGLGDGLGTDWVRYCLGGAKVHFCSPSQDSRDLVQKQFELRGLNGKIHGGPLDALPLADDSMDIVSLSPTAADLPPLEKLVSEIYRVLKPGGKILAALPAKYNAHYWQKWCFPWNYWFEKRPTESGNRYAGRELKTLFNRFTQQRIHKRHLRRSDIPHLWRWIVLPVLELCMGRYLIVKAFKPLGQAPASSVAA
ncbi:MAG: class I SAM-dependent methyltransferase [Planctomycetes bacterium]|nr:class I SAM-dependent methyltransferase [Planctomycetota bacterium]